MIGKLFLLLSVGYLAFLPVSFQKAEDERKSLEGTWVLMTAELGGRKMPDEGFKDTQLVLTEGRYTYQNDHGTFKLAAAEEAKTLKGMDIAGTDGPNKGKTFLAIYELTGDTLKICYDLAGKTRPTEFTTKAGTMQFLATYKKAKL